MGQILRRGSHLGYPPLFFLASALHGGFNFFILVWFPASAMVSLFLLVLSWMYVGRLIKKAQESSPFKERSGQLMAQCPSCGSRMESEANFCAVCGSRITGVLGGPTYSCSNCGTGVPEEARYCPECGFRLIGGDIIRVQRSDG